MPATKLVRVFCPLVREVIDKDDKCKNCEHYSCPCKISMEPNRGIVIHGG